MVSSVQLLRLQQRIRTETGGAVKSRKRRAPGGLRRLPVLGAKRVCVRRVIAPGRSLLDLLMPGVRASVFAAEASSLLEQAVAPVGFHDLWPLGPWPAAGSCFAKDGRLKWQWMCRTCGARAGEPCVRSCSHPVWAAWLGSRPRAAFRCPARRGLLQLRQMWQACGLGALQVHGGGHLPGAVRVEGWRCVGRRLFGIG